MKRKQAYNPYLPCYEYIPDGEPHVFGDRVYVFGSHDKFNGKEFCLNDYICYSANVEDLTDWRYEGVIYKKKQDPRNSNGRHAMWAPDVAKGIDGRFYLYYCLDVLPQIAVAVCDTPAGKYEFLDLVRYKDGVALGDKREDYIQFDPGVFVDEDNSIYLYSGNAPRTKKEIGKEPKHSQVIQLEEDMITIKTKPKLLLPSLGESNESGFEDHEFFEASSIRKINEKYYLVYSSVKLHELCYAVSKKPDEGYEYGGTIISHADIFPGTKRNKAVNPVGNNHGGIEKINGKWYVFYHRQTNKSHFSRQGCAEEISILEDGSIKQVEVTSCGLNSGNLEGKGAYPSYIACNLMGKKGAVFSHPLTMRNEYPYITQDKPDWQLGDEKDKPVQYIRNMKEGSVAGFKYFEFKDIKKISVKTRGKGEGKIVISTKMNGEKIGEIDVEPSKEWKEDSAYVSISDGKHALFFKYEGSKSRDFLEFTLI